MDDRAKILRTVSLAIEECDLHIKRIFEALAIVQKYFPLSANSYEDLQRDGAMAFLDQFVYRYSKLQDKIGSSVIKNIVYLVEYSESGKTFIDKLNILEKEGFIESAIMWEGFRDLRNRLSHEYSIDIEQQIKILNEVYEAYSYISKDFAKMKNFLLSL